MHLGVIFGTLTLITGSIWAKASWGVWWYWGSKQLTTFLIIFLFYCAYFMLRFSIDPGEKRATYSAVYTLLGVGLIPVSVLAVRISQDVIHPITFDSQRPQHGQQHVLHPVRLAGGAALPGRGDVLRGDAGQTARRAGAADPRPGGGRRVISETAVQYVAAVYAVTWVVAIGYIAILHSKLGRLERQLDEVVAIMERQASG